jgi:hypothetical protein
MYKSDGATATSLTSRQGVRQGVRQGDPFGPLFFSAAYRPVLERLRDQLGDRAVVVAYLDDTYLLSVGSIKAEAFEVLGHFGGDGFRLQPSKCQEHDLEDAGAAIELLGSYIGPEPARFLEAAIQAEVARLPDLNELPAQHALLLVRRCLQGRLRHLRHAVLKLRGERTEEQPLDQALVQLPLRLGGLGILSHRDCAPHARRAMQERADGLLERVLPLPGAPGASNGLERLAAASAKVTEYLEDKGREEVRRYGGRTRAPFHPIILSLGGSMSPSTASIFAHWASAMTQEVYRQMELSISISLIRARARWFHL